jgi:hypothetical protein
MWEVPMDYNIQVMEGQGFISVTTAGEWDKAKDDTLVQEIMETIVRSGVRKVLLDMRELRFDFPLFTIFQRAQDLREQRMEHSLISIKVALVYSAENEKTKDDFSFFEVTAQNRGLPYRAFSQMETALEWLTT